MKYHIVFYSQIARNTTPMYRAPEMLDLYLNYPINQAGDIWVRLCYFFKPDIIL